MNTELYSPYRLEQALRLRQESPENIAQEQLFLLKKHLEHALNTPFYRKLYAGKDIAIRLKTFVIFHSSPLQPVRILTFSASNLTTLIKRLSEI